MKSINEKIYNLIINDNLIELNNFLKNNSAFNINFHNSFYEIAFINNNINLLKLLLKNDSKKKDIISYFYNQDFLDSKILKYVLRNGFEISSDIISEFITDKKIDLIKQIFEYIIFDNDFIIKLLLYSNNKRELSNKELNMLITHEKNKINVKS